MYPVFVNNQNQGLANVAAKKCGWLCRTLNKIGDFLDKVPGLGFYADVVQTLAAAVEFGDNNIWGKVNDYEPTPAEEIILNNWVESKLAPFIAQTSKDVLDGLKNPVFATQLAAINLALKRICFLKNYYKNNEIKGLSTMAVTSRLDLINQAVFPVEEIIANAIKNKPVILGSQNVQYNSSEVGTLVFGSFPSYPCTQYSTNKTVPVASVEPISAVELSDAVSTTTGNPVSPSTITQTDNKSGKWLLGLGALAILIALFSNKKSK